MAYFRYRIDASVLDHIEREKAYEVLSEWADILDMSISHPGIYDAFINGEDLSVLKDPALSGCKITDITQSDT